MPIAEFDLPEKPPVGGVPPEGGIPPEGRVPPPKPPERSDGIDTPCWLRQFWNAWNCLFEAPGNGGDPLLDAELALVDEFADARARIVPTRNKMATAAAMKYRVVDGAAFLGRSLMMSPAAHLRDGK